MHTPNILFALLAGQAAYGAVVRQVIVTEVDVDTVYVTGNPVTVVDPATTASSTPSPVWSLAWLPGFGKQSSTSEPTTTTTPYVTSALPQPASSTTQAAASSSFKTIWPSALVGFGQATAVNI